MEFIQYPDELVYDSSVGAMVSRATCLVHFCWDNTDRTDGCGFRVCVTKACAVDF